MRPVYEWKLWFRIADPWASLPFLQEVQQHRLPSGCRVHTSAPADDPRWRIYFLLEGAIRRGDEVGSIVQAPAILAVPMRSRVMRSEGGCRFLFATLAGTHIDEQLGELFGRQGSAWPHPEPLPILTRLSAFRKQHSAILRAHPGKGSSTLVFTMRAGEVCRLAFDLIMALKAQHAAPAVEGPQVARQIVDRAQRIITGTRRRDLTAKELASALGISRKHLGWAFRSVGLPGPYQWMRQQRIERVEAELLTERRLDEIAKDLGFSTASNLGRAFRAVKGCSPSAWRRRQGIALA